MSQNLISPYTGDFPLKATLFGPSASLTMASKTASGTVLAAQVFFPRVPPRHWRDEGSVRLRLPMRGDSLPPPAFDAGGFVDSR